MTFEGYDAFDDPFCYRGSTTLKNKLGLRDPIRLESFELEMTALRAGERFPLGKFDALHYRRIHHHLFQDVYGWAGKYRTVRTSKAGNMFCFPEHIKTSMDRLFRGVTTGGSLPIDSVDQYVSAVANFLADLNAIHPFREGNGRSQLAFIAMLGVRTGIEFDFSRVDRKTFMPAMIASFDGNVAPLRNELRKLSHSKD